MHLQIWVTIFFNFNRIDFFFPDTSQFRRNMDISAITNSTDDSVFDDYGSSEHAMLLFHSSPKPLEVDIHKNLHLDDPFPEESFVGSRSNLQISTNQLGMSVINDVIGSNKLIDITSTKEESETNNLVIIEDLPQCADVTQIKDEDTSMDGEKALQRNIILQAIFNQAGSNLEMVDNLEDDSEDVIEVDKNLTKDVLSFKPVRSDYEAEFEIDKSGNEYNNYTDTTVCMGSSRKRPRKFSKKYKIRRQFSIRRLRLKDFVFHMRFRKRKDPRFQRRKTKMQRLSNVSESSLANTCYKSNSMQEIFKSHLSSSCRYNLRPISPLSCLKHGLRKQGPNNYLFF